MRLLRIRDRPGNDMRQNLCERARRVKRAASCLVGLRDAHRVFLGLRLSASEIVAKAPEQRAPGDDLPKLVQNSGGIVRSFFCHQVRQPQIALARASHTAVCLQQFS